MKKLLYSLLIILVLAVIAGKTLLDRAPIVTGFSALMVSSWTELTHRTQQDVEENELQYFPLNLAKIVVNKKTHEVVSTLFGQAPQKAVYRQGLGSTLIADYDEAYVRKQKLIQKILPENPDTIPWPYGDKLSGMTPENINLKKLHQAIDNAFKTGNTRAVVVCYDTLFLMEKYKTGFDRNTRLLGWSMSKSIINALVGIMVKQGKFDIHAPAPVEEWKSDNRSKITLNNLLQMSSGLEWEEDYTKISDATIMLYEKGNMGKFALDKPADIPPDTEWYYSSGTSNIISLIIKREFSNNEDYWKFPRKELFNKLGMRSAVFETDASGTFVGSSYAFATARDWARFGILYLRKGEFNGRQILPEGWTEYTATPARKSEGKYGAHFWLQPKELPDGPPDTYFADGYHGQRVYIIPSRDVVIVRFGLNKKEEFDNNIFVKEILDAIQ
jgi:hypothetical protein